MLEPGSADAGQAASRALGLSGELDRTIVAVWLHGSAPVATAAREINREVIKMFLAAQKARYSWEEWREERAPAEHAVERFVEAVRSELSLPRLAVAIRISDIATPSDSS